MKFRLVVGKGENFEGSKITISTDAVIG